MKTFIYVSLLSSFLFLPPALAAKLPKSKSKVVPVISPPASFPQWSWNFKEEEKADLARDRVSFELGQGKVESRYHMESFVRTKKKGLVLGEVAKVGERHRFASEGDYIDIKVEARSLKIGERFLVTLAPEIELKDEKSHYFYTIQAEIEITSRSSPNFKLAGYYQAKVLRSLFPVQVNSYIVGASWKSIDINATATDPIEAQGAIYKVSGLLEGASQYRTVYFFASTNVSEGAILNIFDKIRNTVKGQIYVMDWDSDGQIGTGFVLWSNGLITKKDIIR